MLEGLKRRPAIGTDRDDLAIVDDVIGLSQ